VPDIYLYDDAYVLYDKITIKKDLLLLNSRLDRFLYSTSNILEEELACIN
jgi:hypothetical protein